MMDVPGARLGDPEAARPRKRGTPLAERPLPVDATLYPLFQVIDEVLRDALMQMHALVPAHIVWFARIEEKVGLCARFDALGKERQAMLRYHRLVVVALYDLQFSLEFLCLMQ